MGTEEAEGYNKELGEVLTDCKTLIAASKLEEVRVRLKRGREVVRNFKVELRLANQAQHPMEEADRGS